MGSEMCIRDRVSEQCENEANLVKINFPIFKQKPEYTLHLFDKVPSNINSVVTQPNVAIIISDGNLEVNKHIDSIKWSKKKNGKAKSLKIGTYNCSQKINSCQAVKKQWLCDNKC